MIPGNVLIVDDSEAVRQGLSHFLEAYGFDEDHIVTAATAAEGLKKFQRTGPRLAFVDIVLPDSSGALLAADLLRQDPQLKLIVVTGLLSSDDRVREAVSAGAFDVLEKPIRFDRLEALMKATDNEARRLHRVR
jgi:DNA-binding response OmpR family regulator